MKSVVHFPSLRCGPNRSGQQAFDGTADDERMRPLRSNGRELPGTVAVFGGHGMS